MRKVMIVLFLVGLVCLLGITPVLAGEYNEAPVLKELAKIGKIPPVEERLPQEPLVVQPIERIGQYGGDWHHVTLSPTSSWINTRTGYEPFVRYARDARSIVPNIAKGWDVSDGGSTYVFHLRKGMKWSDGAPFSADDVMFWYEDILLNEELTPSFPRWLTTSGEQVKIDKIDDYTVRFRFSEPYGILLDWMAQFDTLFTPKHYMKQFHPRYVSMDKLEAMAKEKGFDFWYQLFGQQQHIAKNPDRPVIKPWKLASTGEVLVVMERNPYYWKVDPDGNQLPYLNRRLIDLISEPEVVNIKTMAGEYDAQLDFLPPANFTLFMENRKAGNYRVLNYKRGESGLTFFPNQTLKGDPVLLELFRNEKFRTALSLAINRDEIQELIYLGLADSVETVLFSSSMWGSAEAARIIERLYSYDPKRANDLLDQVGLQKRNNDGFRLRPDGKVLAITIDVPNAFLELVDGAELVKEYWDNVGIKTAVKSEKFEQFVLRTRASDAQVAAFQINNIGWVSDPRSYVPVSQDAYWGTQYGQWYLSKGKSGLEPPQDIAKLVDFYQQISNTLDMGERARLEEALFKYHTEKVIMIPVVGLIPNLAVVKENFRNLPEIAFNSWPLRFPGYLNPEQFFIEGGN